MSSFSRRGTLRGASRLGNPSFPFQRFPPLFPLISLFLLLNSSYPYSISSFIFYFELMLFFRGRRRRWSIGRTSFRSRWTTRSSSTSSRYLSPVLDGLFAFRYILSCYFIISILLFYISKEKVCEADVYLIRKQFLILISF